MSERKCVNCQHHKFATSSGDCDVSENSMSYSTVFEHSCDQWEGEPNIRKDCKKCIHSDICIFIEENPDCIQFKDRAYYRKASDVAREMCGFLRDDLSGFVDKDYLERLIEIYEKKYTEGER